MKKAVGIVVGLGVAWATQAAIMDGQTIGIDIGVTAPAASENFNAFTNVVIANTATEVFAGPLIDTTGADVSGVGFGIQNNTGFETWAFTDKGTGGYGLMIDSTVYGDGLISNENTSRPFDGNAHFILTFTGLDDTLTYTLTGGWDSDNINFDAVWAADGQSFTTDPLNSTGYGTLSGLSTDGNGNLEITVTEAYKHVTVAGLTLEAIPEPSTLGLLGVAGSALLYIRRRVRR